MHSRLLITIVFACSAWTLLRIMLGTHRHFKVSALAIASPIPEYPSPAVRETEVAREASPEAEPFCRFGCD